MIGPKPKRFARAQALGASLTKAASAIAIISASCTPKGHGSPPLPRPLPAAVDHRHDAEQEDEVVRALDAQRLVLACTSSSCEPGRSRSSRSSTIWSQTLKITSSAPFTSSHCSPEPQRPLEGHALQEAEEERRVAERRQQPAAVRHHEDEEHDDVGLALARLVRAQQRPDQQHRGAGGADHAREQRAERRAAPVFDERRARERAAHVDAAGDHEERAEQQR